MKSRTLRAKAFCALLFPFLGQLAWASQVYDFKVVATNGQSVGAFTIKSLSQNPCINDNGNVAFVAALQREGIDQGQGILACDASASSIPYGPQTDISTSRTVGSVWINNPGQVAATIIGTGNPRVDEVRRYSAIPWSSGSVPHYVVARGGGARDQFGNAQYPFDNIFLSLAMNDLGQVAFSGQVPFTTLTALTNTAGSNKLTLSGFVDMRPAIANDGQVVVRSGGQTSSSILLWNTNFLAPMGIATGAGGFTRTGQSPGISPYGNIVVFCGDRGNGPALFASLQQDPANPQSPRTLIRVVGENAGTNGPRTELGTNSVGSPLCFASFDIDSRVGIVHFPQGQAGAAEDSFTVCFIATPNLPNDTTNGIPFSASKGIWTARVDLDASLLPRVSTILPVLQVNQPLPDDTNAVTELALYEPIAKVASDDSGHAVSPDEGSHRIAFWAATASSSIVVRATHTGGELTFHQATTNAVDLSTPLTIDSALYPLANANTLANQPSVGQGLVADGVTPLLIQFQPKQPPVAPTTYQIGLSVDGGYLKSGTILDHLFVLNGGSFANDTNMVLSAASPRNFAYIGGIAAEDLVTTNPSPELTVTVELRGPGTQLWSKAFQIRRPPIVLVHGYNANSNTWGQAWLDTLTNNVPTDFIRRIEYGVDRTKSADAMDYGNTVGRLDALARELDGVLRKQVESPLCDLRQNWAFTRYDAVGHSQGGVLLRMLCTSSGKFSSIKFRDQQNDVRGRFRRVVTIGSPQNGSTVLYWLLWRETQGYFAGWAGGPGGFDQIPLLTEALSFLKQTKNLIQPKFNPFGDQIRAINNLADAQVDPAAKFHLIATTIAGGAPSGRISCPLLHAVAYLCGYTFYAPFTLGPLPIGTADRNADFVVPYGSDGIVDVRSQLGGDIQPKTTFITNHDISHSSAPLIFGVTTDHAQTQDPLISTRVAQLLAGPSSEFGAFALPQNDEILGLQKQFMDEAFANSFVQLASKAKPTIIITPKDGGGSTTELQFSVAPQTGEPFYGLVNWSVVVYGTNGLTVDGVSLQPNTNDSTRVTVTITNPLVGDVVLSAYYQSTNDHFLFYTPTAIYSEPGTNHLVSIDFGSPPDALPIGNFLTPEVWGTYDNGVRRLLFIPPDGSFALTSSDPQVAVVSSNNIVWMQTNGAATLTASYAGLTAKSTVTVPPLPALFPTATPPTAVDDSAQTFSGTAVTINVLANDISTNGVLDPTTVTITRAPTNGTPSVDAYTGAITYTPNAGVVGTNVDSFKYTVQDDLGSVSSPATVTVVVFGAPQQLNLTSAPYWVRQASSGAKDHRYPMLNNLGGFVYNEQVGSQWQVFGTPSADVNPGQLTVPEGSYTAALSPALADDGSYLCARSYINNGGAGQMVLTDVLRYPSAVVAATNPSPAYVFRGGDARNNNGYGSFWSANPRASSSSTSNAIFSYHWEQDLMYDSTSYDYLAVSDQGSVSGSSWQGDYPDLNADGHFVFANGSQVYLDNNPVLSGQFAHINDAPRDNPEIVYVSGNNLVSSRVGQLKDYNGQALSGSWVDINRSGVLIYEKLVGANYQIFKAYPTEPRIVSTGGTNALVGLPYRYDSDNIAEAYGDPEPDDPRNITPVYWSKVSGPASFHIDANSGHIDWIPDAPGTNTIVISAAFTYLDDFTEVEDQQTLTIQVSQSTIDVVDAVDFRTGNAPDLFTDPIQYLSGGVSRIGATADGASRLALRVRLKGAETNSFPNLHFAIAGANQVADGLLRPITTSNWAVDVAASIANASGTNWTVSLYQSPTDFVLASQPVRVVLLNGTNVIASQSILLRRPPVVLVHDQWSGPDEFGVLFSSLVDAGFDAAFADYSFTSGGSFSSNVPGLYETVADAISGVRQSGFAASRVDMIGHGAGGNLARLHVQWHSAQGDNYGLGDVHKLITIGTPHGGSWLASVITALQTTNPSAYANLRNIILSASQASGYVPAIDLSQGVLADESYGSVALADLQSVAVPSHGIATSTSPTPPPDIYSFIQFCLGLANGGAGVPPANQNDGFAMVDSQTGGIATNASTLVTNVPHLWQPADTNVAALVVGLLKEPIGGSARFAFFPATVWGTNQPPIPAAQTNSGNWLVLSGLTNGQTVLAGQSATLTASATDARPIQSVQFISPVGTFVDTAAPWNFSFTIPTNAAGAWRVMGAAHDANGQLATALLVLNVTNAATLQSIQVDPPVVSLTSVAPFALHVWGLYSDGLLRDITDGSTGTKYKSSDRFQIGVNTTNGVLTAKGNTLTSITISITNGVVFTNVLATANLFNLPPAAVISAYRISGPAPFDVQFGGTDSADPEAGALTYLWDFGDGTTSMDQIPARHRFLVPGAHPVTLRVTDPMGLIARETLTVTVEPRFIMIDASLILTERLSFNEVIVTNGGTLTTPFGLNCGNLFLNASTLNLGTNSTGINATISNARLFGTNGITFSGAISLAGTNYVSATGVFGGGSLSVSGTNLLQGAFVVGDLSVNGSAVLTLSGTNTAGSLVVGSNGVVTTLPGVPLVLSVAGQARVAVGGMLDARDKGYQKGGAGPGASNLGGGSYGGLGGVNRSDFVSGPAYGDPLNPVDFGSSGQGGSGGGVIRLTAQRLLLDGVMRADAGDVALQAPTTQTGSGGSIRLDTGELAGQGQIVVDGGDNRYPYPGLGLGAAAGGGGRLAIYYQDRSGFTGTVSSKGGVGRDVNEAVSAMASGGAGTIYWKKASEPYGELVIDNGGSQTLGWSTPVVETGGVTLARLTLTANTRLLWTNSPLSVTDSTTMSGSNWLQLASGSWLGNIALSGSNVSVTVIGNVGFGDFPLVSTSNVAVRVEGDAVFNKPLTVTGSNVVMTVVGNASFTDVGVSNGAVLALGGTNGMGSLVVGSNGVLAAVPQLVLSLMVTGQVQVLAGGVMDGRGKGYQANGGGYGSGPGRGYSDVGGGYGGLGGNSLANPAYGLSYGVYWDPVDFGSSGGGGYDPYPLGHGGGLIRLMTPRLVVAGVIRADAQDLVEPAYISAGSGGGIRLDVGVLSGGGLINADGGDDQFTSVGYNAVAAGGGGRIAICYGDRSGFTGQVSAKGGVGRDPSGTVNVQYSGGAGTVYWRQTNELSGELVVDNGGNSTVGWSTPIPANGILRLDSLIIGGSARVSSAAGLRVINGNPASFTSLINSNYLQVGSLLVSNTWVFGDVIEPVMTQSNGVPVVTVYCRPQRTYLLLASTNFLYWSSVGTFTPAGSSFTFADTDAPHFGRRFFRAVMLDYFFDGIGISVNRTNRQARLTVSGAQPNHTVVLQASDDLDNWTPLATVIPTAVTNWQFLDTNAPSFQRRFYRAVGQGR